MKKFLALILTGVMVTSISVMAFAETAETEAPAVEEGIEVQVDDEGESTEPTESDEGGTGSPGEGDNTESTEPDEGGTDSPSEGDNTEPTEPDEGGAGNPGEGDNTESTEPDEGGAGNPGEGDNTESTEPDEGGTGNPGEGDNTESTEPDEGGTGSPDEGDITNPIEPDEGDAIGPDGSNGTEEGNKQISDLTTSEEDLKWLHDSYLQYPSNWEHIDSWKLPDGVLAAYIAMYGDPREESSGDSGSSDADEYQYDSGSEAEALAVEATGVSMTTFIGAATENKTVGEYMNNAVTAAPGLDDAIPVSQGGNVIINGVPSNQTFYVLKVLSGHTDSAKTHAASIGGKVLNVARIDARVSFNTATVNFYMPGVKAGQNIQVYQYNYTSGQWTDITVAEVRNDHIVVEMTSLGVLAFIEVPISE